MQKYIQQVKQLFALVKASMNSEPEKHKMSAQSLENLQKALRAVEEIEKQTLEKPYGVIWVDLSMHLLDCMKGCSIRSIQNVINLFLSASKKSPVEHAIDVNKIDPMTQMAAAAIFGYKINPYTMEVAKPVRAVQPKTIVVRSQTIAVQPKIIVVRSQTIHVQ